MRSERVSAADSFRHHKRSLEAGESIPRFPSLYEQLTALSAARTEPVVAAPEPVAAVEDEADDLDAA
ncbi:MAG: hypothetical protein N2544_07960 [Burkholderiales bacterium]|nr:hypothetical protein [Burkholderiales bacterium]